MDFMRGGKFSREMRLGIAVVFGLLFFVTLVRFYTVGQTLTSALIAEDVQRLADIFRTIDATVGIEDFEHDKNYIDFLTIKTFVGSEVGSMNLRYPEKWQGPYLEDNPTMQEKIYSVMKNRQGWFIVPGDGVELSNGKVVGKDLVLDKNTDMLALLRDPEALVYNGKALAAQIRATDAKFKVPEEVGLFASKTE